MWFKSDCPNGNSRDAILLHDNLSPIVYMQDGRTALIQSAGKGHLDIVELLLKYGANKEHQDKVNRARAANLFVVR